MHAPHGLSLLFWFQADEAAAALADKEAELTTRTKALEELNVKFEVGSPIPYMVIGHGEARLYP